MGEDIEAQELDLARIDRPDPVGHLDRGDGDQPDLFGLRAGYGMDRRHGRTSATRLRSVEREGDRRLADQRDEQGEKPEDQTIALQVLPRLWAIEALLLEIDAELVNAGLIRPHGSRSASPIIADDFHTSMLGTTVPEALRFEVADRIASHLAWLRGIATGLAARSRPPG
jgi:hypothetical protein